MNSHVNYDFDYNISLSNCQKYIQIEQPKTAKNFWSRNCLVLKTGKKDVRLEIENLNLIQRIIKYFLGTCFDCTPENSRVECEKWLESRHLVANPKEFMFLIDRVEVVGDNGIFKILPDTVISEEDIQKIISSTRFTHSAVVDFLKEKINNNSLDLQMAPIFLFKALKDVYLGYERFFALLTDLEKSFPNKLNLTATAPDNSLEVQKLLKKQELEKEEKFSLKPTEATLLMETIYLRQFEMFDKLQRLIQPETKKIMNEKQKSFCVEYLRSMDLNSTSALEKKQIERTIQVLNGRSK